ncbi:MAG: hypothetical protein AMXMBFR13_20110 [Phycisphaerae bacterium]|jgi:hypothetical protein
MMVKTMGFWTRVGESLGFKARDGRRRTELPDLPQVGEDGLLADPVEIPGEVEPEAPADRASGPLARWTKRDQTLAALQEGYEKVTRVIEEIQNHLVTQADRSDRMCTALEQLARSMSDAPAMGREQVAMLEQIAARLETTNARTQQLADAVSELPKAARTQSDTLNGVSRQLEMANEQAVVASQNMDRLGTGIRALGETGQAQADLLRQMAVRTAEHENQIARLVSRQDKRFLMLFIVTIILAAGAVTAAIVGIALRGG